MIKLSTIAAALQAEDIESLLASGAPADEYNDEAKRIASAISALRPNEMTQASLVAIIALVWAQSFNRSPQEIELRMPAFERIAQQILN